MGTFRVKSCSWFCVLGHLLRSASPRSVRAFHEKAFLCQGIVRLVVFLSLLIADQREAL